MIYIFPVCQILMCLGAATVYAFAGNWSKVIYWLAAGTITASVTFGR